MKSLDDYKSRFIANYKSMTSELKQFKDKDLRDKTNSISYGEQIGFPTHNGFFYESNMNTASESLKTYRNKSMDIVNELKSEISDIISEIPTEDTSRALQSMQLVKNPDLKYISAMLEKHGNNYTARKVIKDFAREHEIRLPYDANKSELERAELLCDTLNLTTQKMDITNSNNYTDGLTAFVEMEINAI